MVAVRCVVGIYARWAVWLLAVSLATQCYTYQDGVTQVLVYLLTSHG
jgi:hypothetical protein